MLENPPQRIGLALYPGGLKGWVEFPGSALNKLSILEKIASPLGMDDRAMLPSHLL